MSKQINLLQGDCMQTMKTLADNSVDAIVSDPPYGISFMAKKWDYDVPSVEVWKEAMRVLKPGGHALIACGTRTQHRMVVNIEDAGFEIRDVVSWIYGSGFPKSLNISKAIDKAAGAEREVVGKKSGVTPGRLIPGGSYANMLKARDGGATKTADGRDLSKAISLAESQMNITAPATEAAKQWDGWGTALKPSSEFFTLCRKPLSEKTIAANVLKWGTGGINIDGCRVKTDEKLNGGAYGAEKRQREEYSSTDGEGAIPLSRLNRGNGEFQQPVGRFPANLIHDGSQEVLDLFPETKSGAQKSHHASNSTPGANGTMNGGWHGKPKSKEASKGSAARFFYQAKASKKDRDEGNTHPTVKPTALMQYLCRLITPAGGTVLDPYMGSGSTGKAAIKEGFGFVGCELDVDYFAIASTRINNEIK